MKINFNKNALRYRLWHRLSNNFQEDRKTLVRGVPAHLQLFLNDVFADVHGIDPRQSQLSQFACGAVHFRARKLVQFHRWARYSACCFRRIAHGRRHLLRVQNASFRVSVAACGDIRRQVFASTSDDRDRSCACRSRTYFFVRHKCR